MLILASRDVFQWDASDATFDLGGQNVLRTFEMAIRHYRRTTRTGLQRESERVFCRRIYFHLRSKILLWPYYGGDRPHSPPYRSVTAPKSLSASLNLTCQLVKPPV